MSELKRWGGGCPNSECWNADPVDAETREEAVRLLAEQLGMFPGEKIMVGEVVHPEFQYSTGHLVDHLFDEIDENTFAPCDGIPTEHVTTTQREELEDGLKSCIAMWIKRHNLRVHGWTVKNETIEVIPDDPEAENG